VQLDKDRSLGNLIPIGSASELELGAPLIGRNGKLVRIRIHGPSTTLLIGFAVPAKSALAVNATRKTRRH
jgi:hypothetical protein